MSLGAKVDSLMRLVSCIGVNQEGSYMYVADLIKELEQMPADLWVDVMFPEGTDVYTIAAIQRFELSQGNERVVIDIVADMPLRAV